MQSTSSRQSATGSNNDCGVSSSRSRCASGWQNTASSPPIGLPNDVGSAECAVHAVDRKVHLAIERKNEEIGFDCGGCEGDAAGSGACCHCRRRCSASQDEECGTPGRGKAQEEGYRPEKGIITKGLQPPAPPIPDPLLGSHEGTTSHDQRRHHTTDFIVYLLCLTVVAFGGLNNVIGKVRSKPLGRFNYFVALINSVVYTCVYGLLVTNGQSLACYAYEGFRCFQGSNPGDLNGFGEACRRSAITSRPDSSPYSASHVSREESILLANPQVYMGTPSYEEEEMCQYALAAYAVYAAINIIFNLFLIGLLRVGSALFAFLSLKAVLPLSIIMFYTIPWPLLSQADVQLTGGTLGSLFVIVLGIFMYEYERQQVKKQIGDRQPPCCYPVGYLPWRRYFAANAELSGILAEQQLLAGNEKSAGNEEKHESVDSARRSCLLPDRLPLEESLLISSPSPSRESRRGSALRARTPNELFHNRLRHLFGSCYRRRLAPNSAPQSGTLPVTLRSSAVPLLGYSRAHPSEPRMDE